MDWDWIIECWWIWSWLAAFISWALVGVNGITEAASGEAAGPPGCWIVIIIIGYLLPVILSVFGF